MFLGIYIVERESHPLNVSLYILSIFSGMLMLFRCIEKLKAELPK